MKEGELFKNSEFNWNNTGGPQLKKVATGAEFQNTIMPVIGQPIIETKNQADRVDGMSGAYIYTFYHKLGKIYDFYARCKLHAPMFLGSGYLTIPFDVSTALTLAGLNYMDILTIDKEKLEFKLVGFSAGEYPIDFEIYFVDFSI